MSRLWSNARGDINGQKLPCVCELWTTGVSRCFSQACKKKDESVFKVKFICEEESNADSFSKPPPPSFPRHSPAGKPVNGGWRPVLPQHPVCLCFQGTPGEDGTRHTWVWLWYSNMKIQASGAQQVGLCFWILHLRDSMWSQFKPINAIKIIVITIK